MAIKSRFARRHDGLVRLKLRVSGDDLEALERVWPIRYRLRDRDGSWVSEVVVEPTSMTRFFSTVRELGGAWEKFGKEKEKRWQELGVRAIEAAPVERGDPELRALVRERLSAPGVLVIDELGIGRARADVAALSPGVWRGVEVKGAHDTLARLGRQSEVYAQVFDLCELVVAQEHAAAESKVPLWWGVRVVGPAGEEVVREPTQSPEVRALARAQLLWREEAMEALRGLGAARGLSKAARSYVWAALVEATELPELSEIVRTTLSGRVGWLRDEGRGRVGIPLVPRDQEDGLLARRVL